MTPVLRLRFVALCALLLLSSSCVDGDATGAGGEGPAGASVLALQPIFPPGAAQQLIDAPITIIRATVVRLPNEVVSTQDFDVDPDAASWDLDIEFTFQPGDETTVEIRLELLSADLVVQWSGVTEPIQVTGATPSTPAPVELGSGPLSNLSITAIRLNPVDPFDEQTTAQLSADVTVNGDVTPVVTWSSANPAVATVNSNGLVTGVAPGSASISAQAGTVVGATTVTVLAVPTQIAITPPDDLTVGAPGRVFDFAAVVSDRRDDPVQGVEVRWSVEHDTEDEVLRQVAPGRFEVLAEGPATVVAEVASPALRDEFPLAVAFTDARLVVTQSVLPVSVLPGEVAEFTVNVRNDGPGVARGVAVAHAWNGGLTLEGGPPSGFETTGPTSGLWTVGDLAADETAELTLRFRTPASTGNASYNHTATGSVAAPSTLIPGAETSTASAEVGVRNVDLEVSVAGPAAPVAPGDEVTFLVTVRNRGSDAAEGVRVVNFPGSGLIDVRLEPQGGIGTASGATWSVGRLEPGVVIDMRVAGRIEPGFLGTAVTNDAEVSVENPSAHADSNPGNNRRRGSAEVNSFADLELRLVSSPTTAEVGDAPLAAVFELTNTGPAPATGIALGIVPGDANALPIVSASATAGNATTVSWTLSPLAPGASARLTLILDPVAPTAGVATTRVSIQSLNEFDPNTTTLNDAEAPITVSLPETDLSVDITASDVAPFEADQITVTTTVRNGQTVDGRSSPVGDLEIEVPLPSVPNSLTLIAATRTGQATSGYDPTTGRWTVGSMPANASAELVRTYAIRAGTVGQALNFRASLLRTFTGASDPNSANDSDNVTVTPRGVDIDIDKEVVGGDLRPIAGETVTYLIRATNAGQRRVENIRVGEPLASGLTLERTSLTETAVEGQSFTSGVWTIDAIEPGERVELRVVTRVGREQADRAITNTASFLGAVQSDGDASNDRSSVTITPRARQANLTLGATASPLDPVEGDSTVLGITVENSGPHEVTDLEVFVRIPTGLSLRRWPSPALGGAESGGIRWVIGDLEAGGSATIRPVLDVAARTAGSTLTPVVAITSFADAVDDESDNRVEDLVITPREAPRDAVARDYTTLGNTELVGGDFSPWSTYPIYGVGLLDGLGDAEIDPDLVGTHELEYGTLEVQSDGAFSYRPYAGVTEARETFTYTLTNETSAPVTIDIEELVWWLDNGRDPLLRAPETAAPASSSAGVEPVTGGTTTASSYYGSFGTSYDPFGSSHDVENFAPSYAAIIVLGGSGSYGPIELQEGQELIGSGVDIDIPEYGNLVPAGDAPVFAAADCEVAIRLAGGNTLRGLRAEANNSGGYPAIYANVNSSGSEIDRVHVSGNESPLIEITNSSGTFDFFQLEIDGGPGGIRIQGGDANYNVDIASWTQPTGSSWALSLENTDGDFEMSGAAVDWQGGGIYAFNNDGTLVAVRNRIVHRSSDGGPLYLDSNSAHIVIEEIDSESTGSGVWIYNNVEIDLNSVRYVGEEYATFLVDDTYLDANFVDLQYSALGDDYFGDAIRMTDLYDGTDIRIERADILAYGGDALFMSGLDEAGLRASPALSSAAATVRDRREPSEIGGRDAVYLATGAPRRTARANADTPAIISSVFTTPDVVLTIPDPTQTNLTSVGGGGYSGSPLVLERLEMDVSLGTVDGEDIHSGLQLHYVTGSISIDDFDASDLTGGAVLITGGDPDVDIDVRDGSVEATNSWLARIRYTGSADIDFTGGAMRSNGGYGIELTDNDESTITFDVPLDIRPTDYAVGLNATGGGTLEILGSSNVIETRFAEAVIMNGVEVGENGVTFARVAVEGDGFYPDGGIQLTNTGTRGTFSVTPTTAGIGAGGVFTSMGAGRGIVLDNVHGASFEDMDIEGGPALRVTGGSSDLAFRSMILRDGYFGPAVDLDGIDGSVVFDDVDFYGNDGAIDVAVYSGADAHLEGRDLEINGGDLEINTYSSAVLRTELSGVRPSSISGTAIRVDVQGTSTHDFSLRDSDFGSGLANGVDLLGGPSGSRLFFDVRNVEMAGLTGRGVTIHDEGGTVEGVLFDNDISSTDEGIRAFGDGVGSGFTGTAALWLQGNQVFSSTEPAVLITMEGGTPSTATGTASVTIVGNQFEGEYGALDLRNSHSATLCLNVGGNVMSGGEIEAGYFDFNSGTTRIERLGGGSGSEWSSTTIRDHFLSEDASVSPDWSGIGVGDGVAHGSCATPTTDPFELGNLPPVVIPAAFGVDSSESSVPLTVYAVDRDDASLLFGAGTLTTPDVITVDTTAVSNLSLGAKSVSFDFNATLNPIGLYKLEITATDGSGADDTAEARMQVSDTD